MERNVACVTSSGPPPRGGGGGGGARGGGGGGGAAPPPPTAEAPEHAPGPTQKGYFLVISLKIGTEFQPNFTLSTFSLKPPVVPWYQSGIEGMSSRRIS